MNIRTQIYRKLTPTHQDICARDQALSGEPAEGGERADRAAKGRRQLQAIAGHWRSLETVENSP